MKHFRKIFTFSARANEGEERRDNKEFLLAETRPDAARTKILLSAVGPQIFKIMEDIGMPYDVFTSTEDSGYGWTGEKLCVKGYTIGDTLHDMAHYQVSSVERRRYREYGLGPGFSTYDNDGATEDRKKAGLEEKYSEVQREEEYASILGILWEGYLGFNYTMTMSDHNWLGGRERRMFLDRCKVLLNAGLIDNRGVPQIAASGKGVVRITADR